MSKTNITIPRDTLRQALVDNSQGYRNSMLSSSVDARTNNIGSLGEIPQPLVLLPLEVSTYGQKVYIQPGTVLGVMPKIDAAGGEGGATEEKRLDVLPQPYMELDSAEGTFYLVMNITLEFQITDSIYVNPTLVGTAVKITIEDTDPGGDGIRSDEGKFFVLLATIVNTKKTLQNGYGPIGGELCDTLQGTATAQLNLSYPGYGV